jgi:hypothetical protein
MYIAIASRIASQSDTFGSARTLYSRFTDKPLDVLRTIIRKQNFLPHAGSN